MERTWTTVGEEKVERLGGREKVARKIERMEWREIPENGWVDVGMMPGEAIKATIKEFGIPKVQRFSITSFEMPEYYPGFYGIEAIYKNGLARIYVLDEGASLTPLASDFEPVAEEVPA